MVTLMSVKRNKDFFFVGIQILLLGTYLIPVSLSSLPFDNTLNKIGLIIAALGLFIVLIAIIQLNKNLTPFPTPKDGSELIKTGLFKLVRHPIYTGIMLTVTGYSLYRESLWKLLVSLLLGILFYYKSRYEEGLLRRRYRDYSDYMKTTGRFFP
jgi:protein-S-isoprenylcysteine O-methyltransferase Ste14